MGLMACRPSVLSHWMLKGAGPQMTKMLTIEKDCQNSWIVFIFLITFQVREGSCPDIIWH